MAQADTKTITIRGTAPQAAIVYLPFIHNKSGDYLPELRNGDTTKATIVADIASAQHDAVIRVIAFDISAGTSWDASAEIAHAVLDVVLTDQAHVPHWCRDFIEEHLGVNYVQACQRQAA